VKNNLHKVFWSVWAFLLLNFISFFKLVLSLCLNLSWSYTNLFEIILWCIKKICKPLSQNLKEITSKKLKSECEATTLNIKIPTTMIQPQTSMGSFHVNCPSQSDHYLRFYSNFISRKNFSYWFQQTKYFWSWLRFCKIMEHTKWLLYVVIEKTKKKTID